MARSLKATQSALDDQIDPARIRKRWKQHDERWAEAAGISLKTLQRFWDREPIRRANFIAICQAIDIEDWKMIADLSARASSDSSHQSLSLSIPERLVVPQEIKLKTEKNIDFTNLVDLLATNRWKIANYETKRLLLQTVGEVGEEAGFTYELLEQISCTDLSTVDQLWLKYSKGHFGFSIQKLLYDEVGQSCSRLGDQVGWRKNGEWLICLDDLFYSLNAPTGHLPFLVWGSYLDALLFRFESCEPLLLAERLQPEK
ncbi:GUN4 domain-containing protein [Leptolyngbya sp. 7M]|uniref:GUN4 domain-containing protein n=1 Tax=Leptolyngbya sp. 7M TaxID=2812896 RepID=UPI001B8CE922|nr:GUN4 domain-containing protein [Leptolyngbya sp. 7M]QYO63385.1 GUN4 domain-containing protein [Leptolyngbya sp. 7M]